MRKALDLSKLEFVVLDEADRMLDIGFRPDIEKILRRCPDSRQTMLMSATIPPEVDHLARHYMNNPEKLDFSPKNLAVETIEQSYFSVAPERKVELLKRLLERENPHQAIIFCRTKKRTEQLTAIVKKWYPDALGMHGDMEQDKRMKTIQKFRDGKVRLLVATDVVGRGLDISGVSHIINYDIPQFCDDYVHRVGRTGRMGKEGVAFTFVTAEEGVELTRIEMRINKLLKRDEIPGFAAFATPAATSSKPDADNSHSEPISEEPPKPVFGQRTRRVRRAL
jgi:ATP-dependent RNA helicase DeaD